MKKELSFRQKVNLAEKKCMIQDILSVTPKHLQANTENRLMKGTFKAVEQTWNEVYIPNTHFSGRV